MAAPCPAGCAQKAASAALQMRAAAPERLRFTPCSPDFWTQWPAHRDFEQVLSAAVKKRIHSPRPDGALRLPPFVPGALSAKQKNRLRAVFLWGKIGGAGGNRTRVRKPSPGRSTCLARCFGSCRRGRAGARCPGCQPPCVLRHAKEHGAPPADGISLAARNHC